MHDLDIRMHAQTQGPATGVATGNWHLSVVNWIEPLLPPMLAAENGIPAGNVSTSGTINFYAVCPMP